MLAMGAAEEVGEFGQIIFKKWRYENKTTPEEFTEAEVENLVKEMGDLLWYVAATAHVFGIPMSQVAQGNVDKLSARTKAPSAFGSTGGNSNSHPTLSPQLILDQPSYALVLWETCFDQRERGEKTITTTMRPQFIFTLGSYGLWGQGHSREEAAQEIILQVLASKQPRLLARLGV
jgi:NTP pyrophosphatase (non-canonical NTP hydrolase)